MNEYDLMNLYFIFIFKDGNKSFRDVYGSYEQLGEFKNWLTKQNIKFSMSIRIYLNTLKQAYDAILNTGIEAKYNEIDKGDYMEVVVKIPKK